MILRKKTRVVKVGNVRIGGGNPVVVQSMTNTDTRDVRKTVEQIKRLQDAGCEIVRVGVPDMKAAQAIGKIKSKIHIPIVADIHFDHNLALEAIRQGVDKLRLNPGNIRRKEHVAEVVESARESKIPIRIGVNAGSLKEAQETKDVGARAKAMVRAAQKHIDILEAYAFFDIVVSLKSSDVATTVAAYKLLAARVRYPLHLGITEAGSLSGGTVKSSVGLGILLFEGLGDTVRVSLTADPVEEVTVAYRILQSLKLRSTGIEIISCPTCSRCEVDLINIVEKLEDRLAGMRNITKKLVRRPVTVAVMGCEVNGPGEAREADFGIAGGKKSGMLFVNGKPKQKILPSRWVDTLIKLIKKRAGCN